MSQESEESDEKKSSRRKVQLFYSPRVLPGPDEVGENARERFVQSIVRKEYDIFNALIDRVDLNKRAQLGWTPVMWATHKDRPAMLEKLLKYKVNLNAENRQHQRAIHMACNIGKSRHVKLLIHSGNDINVDVQNKEGDTPLIIATSKGFDDIVKVLIEQKANVNIRNKGGWTALMKACRNGHYTTVKLLTDSYGPLGMDTLDFNAQDSISGRTAFIHAVRRDHKQIVDELLQYWPKTINIDMQDKWGGWNALFWASFDANMRMVKLLLAQNPPAAVWMRDRGWSDKRQAPRPFRLITEITGLRQKHREIVIVLLKAFYDQILPILQEAKIRNTKNKHKYSITSKVDNIFPDDISMLIMDYMCGPMPTLTQTRTRFHRQR